MTRISFLEDFLQNYPFWLMDVGPIDSIGLPLFTPIFGFSSITAPQVSVSVREIIEGNYHYTRKVFGKANTAPLTLVRGSIFYDSDFWKWIQASIEGDTGGSALSGNLSLGIPGPTPRRNLLLIHFFSRGPLSSNLGNAAIGATGLIGLSSGAALSSSATSGISAAAASGAFAAFTAVHPNDVAIRIPAKAWILKDCIPTRYKPASDFDANSSEVSLLELDIEYEKFDEIGLAA